jgi:hypothetical protein
MNSSKAKSKKCRTESISHESYLVKRIEVRRKNPVFESFYNIRLNYLVKLFYILPTPDP